MTDDEAFCDQNNLFLGIDSGHQQFGMIVSGSEADITVTRGIGAELDAILNDMLDPVDGSLQTIDDRFDQELESLQESLDRQQELFNLQQESLISQFVALESALSELNSTSDFLNTQLASLQATSASRNN